MAKCNVEVNFNVQPGEKIMYCPYFDNHYFRETRAHYHLKNCRRQYEIEKRKLGQPLDIVICPFSYKHHIPLKDWGEHQRTCVISGKQEAEAVGEVSAEEKEAASSLGPNCFMVPGTGQIVQTNTGSSRNERFDWEVPKKSLPGDSYSNPRRVPGLMGMDTRVPQNKPIVPETPFYSHMDRAAKVGGQPIGLTKSEKKRWQEANMEKVKKEIREEEARELFRQQTKMEDVLDHQGDRV